MSPDELSEREFFKVPFSDIMKLAAGTGGTPTNYIPYTEDERSSRKIVHGPSLGRLSARG
ncbi:MAG: hypothetical protein LBI10_02280 [Deltaproteobacteria bacterium]|nr:hypothetical protein [Deltaproteobacteria bacterium]